MKQRQGQGSGPSDRAPPHRCPWIWTPCPQRRGGPDSGNAWPSSQSKSSRSQSWATTLMWSGTSSFGPKSDCAWKLGGEGEPLNIVCSQSRLCLAYPSGVCVSGLGVSVATGSGENCRASPWGLEPPPPLHCLPAGHHRLSWRECVSHRGGSGWKEQGVWDPCWWLAHPAQH